MRRLHRAGPLAVALIVAACSSGSVNPASLDEQLSLDAADLDHRTDLLAEVHETITDCMEAEGFAYTPYVPQPDTTFLQVNRAAVVAGSDRAYSQRHGYGVAESMRDSLIASLEDPNRDAMRSLGEAEFRAFTVAFDRCNAEAISAAGIDMKSIVSVNEEMLGSLQDLDARILLDSRVIDLENRWSACLGEAGYRFSALAEPVEEVRGFASEAAQTVNLDQSSHDAAHEVEDAFADVIRFELEIADVDVECRNEVGLLSVLADVRQEYEEQFLDDEADLISDFQESFG